MAEQVSGAQEPRWSAAPYFIVNDVVTTANFYRDKLGFKYERFWGEKPCFTIVRRGGVSIMLRQLETRGFMHPNYTPDPEDFVWDAYIWTENADALHEEFSAKGVKIGRPLCDQEYGCREFDIEDCNGFRLCFGHCV
jgi:predicted enzyme related to lactoylglutathione lyase